MPTYKLSSGESFDTMILPKGTVLFRGFEMEYDGEWLTETPFTELFGRQDDEGHFCVNSHQNVFFYPAPYMVDVVNRYSIHAIFVTNYDTELVLMARPSLQTRDVRGTVDKAPSVSCTDIAKTNKCGIKMIHHDPCLSPLLIKEYPNIHGYIAIASNDAGHFEHGYFWTMYEHNLETAKTIAPFIVENARKIQSVPEIVLYPYHARISEDVRKVHPRAVEDRYIEYALKHRAELNYFPLLYITETKVYTWLDLKKLDTRLEMAKTERTDHEYISPLFEKEKAVLAKLLSPEGLSIDGKIYRFTIDLRTGVFSVSDQTIFSDKNDRVTNINLYKHSYSDEKDSEKNYKIPFHYPQNVKRDIFGFLRRATLTPKSELDLSLSLNRIGASFSKHYMFEIKNPTKLKTVYKFEAMFPRPEFNRRRRFTRKIKL